MNTTVKITLIPSAFTTEQAAKIIPGSVLSKFATALEAKLFFNKVRNSKYLKAELI